ncbi:hypothetical protein GQ44DRAFT_624203 [Phaeosphaeriaceae sp. PMI808]|nr:hypothetical protein GQ44DRAFT_624203 [Phaeosphaeriaceae sp. PMI808]
MADRRPLIHETSDLLKSSSSTPVSGLQFSDSAHSLAHIPPPPSPPASRSAFSKLQSDATLVERSSQSAIHEGDEERHVADSLQRQGGSGLGIRPSDPPALSAKRVSIQEPPGPFSPPGSANPFTDSFAQDSPTENTPDLRRERFSSREEVVTFEEFRRGLLKNARQSTASVDDYQQYIHNLDTDRLRGAPSIKSAYENDFRPIYECPSTRDFYQSSWSWLNVTIITICLFSCVFSGIFLFLAIYQPFYGKRITSHGPTKPADAILLTTIFAKLIEISFVTSFVAFLGQVLSRRAFMKEEGRGVTLSELSMWRWVVQPGTLITHWETAKYAGITVLGILSLVSAALSTLYSSAATALVQPTLRQTEWTPMLMGGRVKTDFANINYVKGLCQTPIRTDQELGGNTCLQIEHAGQGYHNYQRYLAEWDNAAKNSTGTTDQHKRPPGFGLLYENTTISAQWIDIIDTAKVSKKYGRAINNVSLAMPHSGVFEAAHSPRNGILQPEELNSEGTYSIRASVLSPVLNVICVNMNEDELKPIVFDTWNDEVVNITTWTPALLQKNATTTAKTVVDEIFGWKNDSRSNYPPVFAKYPNPYNTIMNHTSVPWGRDAVYLLGQGGADKGSNMTGIYSLCKIHMAVTPNCATQYNARSGGGWMGTLCGDKAAGLAFNDFHPEATWITSIPNWKDIGFDWSNSLSLHGGLVDADASNSRLLTQLILNPSNSDPNAFEVDLNPALPSMGEALAVMSGCTLLKGMLDAPFVMKWNHTNDTFGDYQIQNFPATLKAQQYASGGLGNHTSRAWLVVLILVFGMNIFVLIYFILHRGLVTDFSEPPNLFALAVNSPPSHALAGSCGGGPEGEHYMVNWFVKHEGSHLFMEPGEKSSPLGNTHVHSPVDGETTLQAAVKPGFFASMTTAIKRGLGIKDKAPKKLAQASGVESLRSAQSRPVSMVGSEYEMQEGYERTRKQYAKLANRRSRL